MRLFVLAAALALLPTPALADWVEAETNNFIIKSEDTPENTRVESRFAGSDANPYLAMAGTLACGLLGIRERLQPMPAMDHSAQDAGFALPPGLGFAAEDDLV